eukprot:TRINITY_DN2727_c0_g3_i1.p1 TRINITY_DN2727_c0_g3~~TRINITY_DN2727_c0_g3_i1.p1  ORF type:complete len:1372 (+),score=273.46 TRINITY_DN2727_c0_g3_i1:2419-6534(+)
MRPAAWLQRRRCWTGWVADAAPPPPPAQEPLRPRRAAGEALTTWTVGQDTYDDGCHVNAKGLQELQAAAQRIHRDQARADAQLEDAVRECAAAMVLMHGREATYTKLGWLLTTLHGMEWPTGHAEAVVDVVVARLEDTARQLADAACSLGIPGASPPERPPPAVHNVTVFSDMDCGGYLALLAGVQAHTDHTGAAVPHLVAAANVAYAVHVDVTTRCGLAVDTAALCAWAAAARRGGDDATRGTAIGRALGVLPYGAQLGARELMQVLPPVGLRTMLGSTAHPLPIPSKVFRESLDAVIADGRVPAGADGLAFLAAVLPWYVMQSHPHPHAATPPEGRRRMEMGMGAEALLRCLQGVLSGCEAVMDRYGVSSELGEHLAEVTTAARLLGFDAVEVQSPRIRGYISRVYIGSGVLNRQAHTGKASRTWLVTHFLATEFPWPLSNLPPSVRLVPFHLSNGKFERKLPRALFGLFRNLDVVELAWLLRLQTITSAGVETAVRLLPDLLAAADEATVFAAVWHLRWIDPSVSTSSGRSLRSVAGHAVLTTLFKRVAGGAAPSHWEHAARVEAVWVLGMLEAADTPVRVLALFEGWFANALDELAPAAVEEMMRFFERVAYPPNHFQHSVAAHFPKRLLVTGRIKAIPSVYDALSPEARVVYINALCAEDLERHARRWVDAEAILDVSVLLPGVHVPRVFAACHDVLLRLFHPAAKGATEDALRALRLLRPSMALHRPAVEWLQHSAHRLPPETLPAALAALCAVPDLFNSFNALVPLLAPDRFADFPREALLSLHAMWWAGAAQHDVSPLCDVGRGAPLPPPHTLAHPAASEAIRAQAAAIASLTTQHLAWLGAGDAAALVHAVEHLGCITPSLLDAFADELLWRFLPELPVQWVAFVCRLYAHRAVQMRLRGAAGSCEGQPPPTLFWCIAEETMHRVQQWGAEGEDGAPSAEDVEHVVDTFTALFALAQPPPSASLTDFLSAFTAAVQPARVQASAIPALCTAVVLAGGGGAPPETPFIHQLRDAALTVAGHAAHDGAVPTADLAGMVALVGWSRAPPVVTEPLVARWEVLPPAQVALVLRAMDASGGSDEGVLLTLSDAKARHLLVAVDGFTTAREVVWGLRACGRLQLPAVVAAKYRQVLAERAVRLHADRQVNDLTESIQCAVVAGLMAIGEPTAAWRVALDFNYRGLHDATVLKIATTATWRDDMADAADELNGRAVAAMKHSPLDAFLSPVADVLRVHFPSTLDADFAALEAAVARAPTAAPVLRADTARALVTMATKRLTTEVPPRGVSLDAALLRALLLSLAADAPARSDAAALRSFSEAALGALGDCTDCAAEDVSRLTSLAREQGLAVPGGLAADEMLAMLEFDT